MSTAPEDPRVQLLMPLVANYFTARLPLSSASHATVSGRRRMALEVLDVLEKHEQTVSAPAANALAAWDAREAVGEQLRAAAFGGGPEVAEDAWLNAEDGLSTAMEELRRSLGPTEWFVHVIGPDDVYGPFPDRAAAELEAAGTNRLVQEVRAAGPAPGLDVEAVALVTTNPGGVPLEDQDAALSAFRAGGKS